MLNLSRWILFHVVTVVVAAAQPDASPTREDSYGLYSHFEPSMVIVVMVLVCAFFVVGFLSFYIRHCNEANAIAAAAAATAPSVERSPCKGLDQAVIESFPVFVYSYVKDLKLGKYPLECAVCLSEFEDDETLRLLPKCSHVFHPDCIDAWLAYHVTCPVCRAKLTSDSDVKPAQSSSNIAELNSYSNTESSSTPPTTQRAVEERNEFIIQVNEETRPREGKIRAGKFPRSHSTGHSLIQPGENMERFTLRLPEEIRKQIAKSGKLKRTRSYNVVLGREGSTSRSSKGGEGSSRGKSYTERWVFLRTPPFVPKRDAVKGGAGGVDGSLGKSNCVNLSSGV
ncbi:hypothetical protein PTKIN_Ptkin08bG0138400 [Pterospermum kingtungense]